MVALLRGRIHWDRQDDQDGHRSYNLDWLVETSSTADGPAVAMACAGLPAIGAPWIFGNDNDFNAFCHPSWRATPAYTGEPGNLWVISQPFSTRPLRRCQDTQIENPLAEPPRLSGSFVKYMRAAQKDRHGKPIRNVAGERIKGAAVEFEASNPTVQIGLTSLLLPLEQLSAAIDTVNDAPLWGLDARMVKFANVSWTRLLYGSCNFYYEQNMEFECDFRTWDRKLPQEGNKCLQGWMPGSEFEPLDPDAIDPDTGLANYKNPNNYEVYKDKNGENARCFLDSRGRPVTDIDDVDIQTLEYYEESNLLLLGIPSSL